MSPETGTFTTMDTYAGTLDNPVSLHKYLYANGNPVMYTDPTGNFSLMETSVAQGIQATINTIITPGFSLQKMLTLANLAVTAYDVATTMRMVFCGEATVLDVALCIVKGLVVQSLISCVATAVFGKAAAFMLKLVGIGQDTYGLIEAIKSKDPKEIVIATVRLAVSVFTLKSQCFAGDTLVSTEEGNRRIDEIKPGDKVLSYNTETGENELQEVKNVSVSKTDILVHIITDDGRDIETTMFHPFYVKNEDGTGEWKAASNLKAGDELLSEDGKKVKVSEVKVEKLAEEITVYNLELDEVHTYYVAGGVLVHNMCATDKNSDSETSYGKSREIIQCNTKDAAADELAKRIGGQSRSAFADDPIQREFDVISDQYIAQAKPPLKCVNKTVRTQMKATFEAAKKYERKVYYQFEGIPSQEVLDKLYEYSERYGVEVIIDTEPLGILN